MDHRSLLLLTGVTAATIGLLLLLLVLFRGKPVPEEAVRFEPIDFSEIEGWQEDDQAAAFATLLKSCRRIAAKSGSANVSAGTCAAALALAESGEVSREAARGFFEAHYTPYRVVAPKPGRITGYYEPEIEGARKKSAKFPVAAYGRPGDLVSVTPDEMRARDSAAGVLTAMRKTDAGLVPFDTREEIDKGALAGRNLELVYLDPVELFFMQVQGSGRVRLADGTHLRLGYATKNGHPYTSIGKLLAKREDRPKALSMQGIKDWIHADRDRGNKLMWENKSYVFFRLLDGEEGEDGPIGAHGVSLTAERSLAVDPAFHALGLPVFVEAPELKTPDGVPFRRLMIAQDVGSAIKGPERGDIYWGSGDKAGTIAGSTLAPAHFIVLKPNDATAGS